MSKINGRITITAADATEYEVLRAQAEAGPPYTVISEDPATFTLVVDLTDA